LANISAAASMSMLDAEAAALARDLRQVADVVGLEHRAQREAVDERVGQHALVGRGADDRDRREVQTRPSR
jgi:hypothetical protein